MNRAGRLGVRASAETILNESPFSTILSLPNHMGLLKDVSKLTHLLPSCPLSGIMEGVLRRLSITDQVASSNHSPREGKVPAMELQGVLVVTLAEVGVPQLAVDGRQHRKVVGAHREGLLEQSDGPRVVLRCATQAFGLLRQFQAAPATLLGCVVIVVISAVI